MLLLLVNGMAGRVLVGYIGGPEGAGAAVAGYNRVEEQGKHGAVQDMEGHRDALRASMSAVSFGMHGLDVPPIDDRSVYTAWNAVKLAGYEWTKSVN